jgi:uncharacterized membrane protein YGL010W
MKTIDEQMAIYAAYHRDTRNKLTHFVGVPMIMFALLLGLAWIRVPVGGFELTGAMLLALVVLAYYFRLDVALAVTMTVVTLALLWLAGVVARMEWATSVAVFLFTFIVGWIIQLVGHYYEGRRPALVDNIFQIFVAPLSFSGSRGVLRVGPQARSARCRGAALACELHATARQCRRRGDLGKLIAPRSASEAKPQPACAAVS